MAALPFHVLSPSTAAWRREAACQAKAEKVVPETGGRRVNLSARRRERIQLPQCASALQCQCFTVGHFLRHQAGVEALLNTRALQSFESLQSNTYRCTLNNIQFFKFEVTPVLDLRVTPTTEGCTVEMLSCRFEGSEIIAQQNHLFSASMRNRITWEENDYEAFLDVDVNLDVSLEVYTKPFSLLPLSTVEKPGNLLMQGLLDKLVPLLAEQLLRDYQRWVEGQSDEISSQHSCTQPDAKALDL